MLRPTRIALLHGSLLLFALALIARAAQVQLWQRDTWLAKAQRQHYVTAAVPAPRGDIYDERGAPLAQSREMLRLSIAPKELADRRTTARALAALRLDRDWVARATDPAQRWVVLPGSYLPGDVAPLARMRGVYAEPVMERLYTAREATRRVVGTVDAQGVARGGLELALDSLLRGQTGHATMVRDSRGGGATMPLDTTKSPAPGDAVVLTINQELQEISERALDSAVRQMGADGGDIVILDPLSGEIRALASLRRDQQSLASPAIGEPFEPGSTIKPLIAARLLTLKRARVDERLNVEGGRYELAGRTITDDHPASVLSMADVIRYSSNIGMVKLASRLSPREEYAALRDVGFGMPTGLPLAGEASGLLRAPAHWSKMSPASLAMGYEVSVTPIQLAAAYAPLANGGDLLEPAIVKEIRAPDGRVIYRHERRVVRRVMSDSVARSVRAMMEGVVEGGTGTRAALKTFALAGKSGTSRRASSGHGYAAGQYTASFVGLFPADHPQYVMLVKLDNPRGEYYAAKTAAPVSKIVLEAAIAARDAALDRAALAASESLAHPVLPADSLRLAERSPSVATPADSPTAKAALTPIVLSLPRRAPPRRAPSAHAVPDVRGLPVRQAVYALHRAGFRVQLGGVGEATETVPAAGALVREGAVVRLVTGP